MVDDEPRPSWNGSNTSSTSVCIISFTSKAILPQMPVTRPRKQPTSAKRSEEHTSELQSHSDLVCRLLLEKKKSGEPHHGTTDSPHPRTTNLTNRAPPEK